MYKIESPPLSHLRNSDGLERREINPRGKLRTKTLQNYCNMIGYRFLRIAGSGGGEESVAIYMLP